MIPGTVAQTLCHPGPLQRSRVPVRNPGSRLGLHWTREPVLEAGDLVSSSAHSSFFISSSSLGPALQKSGITGAGLAQRFGRGEQSQLC